MATSLLVPKVAVLVETSRAFGRGLMEGISQYVHRHGPWSIYHHERTLRDGPPEWIKHWSGDGIMARMETRRAIQKISRMGVPTIDLFSWYTPPGMSTIKVDEWNVSRMAADHLLERGFRHFAYCGFTGVDYSDHRCQCFVKYLAERGYDASVYGEPYSRRKGRFTSTEVGGLVHEQEIVVWLNSLPKPLGLMACNDIRGQQVLNACTECSITVPDEVAVIGVDNDQLLCQLCLPPLSSIELDCTRAGYEAARILDQMMRVRKRSPREVAVKPLSVVTRQSTDAVATADRDVVAAVQLIRSHATEGMSVEDVLDEIALSRSTLERRFQDLFGHTIKGEIDRVKLNRVKELLARTDWPLARIARNAGFQHVEPMCRLFKRKTRQTPGQYRNSTRV